MDSAVDFVNLFVENNAGELLYFLIAVSLSLATLLMAVEQSTRSPRETEARRYMWTLAGVVLAWGALTSGNLYSILSDTNGHAILPPLERATTTVVILLLGWAFLAADSAERERDSRAALFILILLIGAGYAFTQITWQDEPTSTEFNQHTLGVAWTVIPMLFIGLGMVLLFTRYRSAADIPLKLLFFVIVLAGHAYTLYQMSQNDLVGNAPGAVRVAMLAALTMLPIIVYRLIIERFRQTVGEVSGWVPTILSENTPVPQVRTAPAPPPPLPSTPDVPVVISPAAAAQREAMTLLRILGIMLEKTDPRDIPKQITRAVATTFHADVVALMSTENPNWADTVAAYNYVKEKDIPGLVLDLNDQPTLAHSIELNMQSVLLPTRSSEEVTDLFRRLDITETGPSGAAYFQPLSRERRVVGMIILAFPYTARLLGDEEKKLLESLGPIAARLLLVSREASRARAAADPLPDMLQGLADPIRDEEAEAAIRAELQAKLEDAQNQVVSLGSQIADLQRALEHEREKLTSLMASGSQADMSITQQIQTLSTERKRLEGERQDLMGALQEVQTILAGATADTDETVYRQMIDTLNAEKQSLLAEKQRLERELSQFQNQPPDHERLADIINTLMAEKDRLADEHNRLKTEIQDTQDQLKELGVEEGFMGFAQLFALLTEERNRFLKESKRAMAERDKLLRERRQYENRDATNDQIENLQLEVSRLASDREAIIRQRDALKNERDALNMQREEWLESRVKLTEQYEKLRQDNEKVRAALTETETRLRNAQGQLTDTQQIMVGQVEPNAVIQQLESRLTVVEEHRSDLEYELIRARRDIELLENELTRLEEVAANATERSEREAAEMIVGLTQELRTPLTSIKGYTDLLLGESMGILGETQKQFIMRIQVNVEQLQQHVENLVRVLAIDYGNLLLIPRKVDVEDLIDDAITASSAQYREKGLTLHLDIAPELPNILADKDAMQQILTRLLTNAYLASPPDSAVHITAQHIRNFEMNDGKREVIYFGITDHGGGIPEEDRERVFNRHYRAENPLIQGLGDKGAGLSIVRALVLAHGGVIWLDTKAGVSTTFKVVIPVDHTFGEKDMVRGNVSRLIDAFQE